MKIRPNDPCPCGSTRKFKNCCRPKDRRTGVQQEPRAETPTSTSFSHLIDFESRRPVHSAIPVIQTEHRGKRMRAVWNRLYERPRNESLGEFSLLVLKWTLGRTWFLGECAKEAGERHQIVQWFYHYFEWQNANKRPENAVAGGWSARPDGDVRALLCLSEDVLDLQSVNRLPRALLKRLKNQQGFQGARYEIAVAAIFARLGYEIEWLEGKGEKHCEFIATHRPTEIRIAVEAKSRHRKGVLGQPGEHNVQASLKADVGRQLREAIGQAPGDLPFMIFIDLNAPPTSASSAWDAPWSREFLELVSRGGPPTPERPDPYNAIFLTNYAYHHLRGEDATGGREFLICVSSHPKNRLPDPRYLTELKREVETYGRPRQRF